MSLNFNEYEWEISIQGIVLGRFSEEDRHNEVKKYIAANDLIIGKNLAYHEIEFKLVKKDSKLT